MGEGCDCYGVWLKEHLKVAIVVETEVAELVLAELVS